jgi:hypothetical protein
MPPKTQQHDKAPATGPAPSLGGEAPAAPTTDSLPTMARAEVAPNDRPTTDPVPKPAEHPPYPAVPGYEILEELGRGGMGVVYKARQVKANRVVALKMILARAHATLEQKIRFQIEAEAVAALQHPNIVQLYEVGECDGLPFFSLEFCPRGNLNDLLRKRRAKGQPLPVREAAGLVEALARAMHYAHSHGVIFWCPRSRISAWPKGSTRRAPSVSPVPSWARPVTWPRSKPRDGFATSAPLPTCGHWASSCMSC